MLFCYLEERRIRKGSLSKWAFLNPFNPQFTWGLKCINYGFLLFLFGAITLQFATAPLLISTARSGRIVGIVMIYAGLIFYFLSRRKKRSEQTLPDRLVLVFGGSGGYLVTPATDLWLCGVKGSEIYRVLFLEGCRQYGKRGAFMYSYTFLILPLIWFLFTGMPYVHEFWMLVVAWVFFIWASSKFSLTARSGVAFMKYYRNTIAPHRKAEMRSWWKFLKIATIVVILYVIFLIPYLWIRISMGNDPGLLALYFAMMLIVGGIVYLSLIGRSSKAAIETYQKLMETGDEDFNLFMRQTVMEDPDCNESPPSETNSAPRGSD